MAKIHKMEQRSPEWLQIRHGKITGSDANDIINMGDKINDFVRRKAMDRLGLSMTMANRATEAMRNGITNEPIALELYEKTTKQAVEQIGFAEYDGWLSDLNGYCGCSPDGLVGSDGMIEIKCPLEKNFSANTRSIPKKYRWQMIFNLFVTGRMWCDYVVYSKNEPLFVHRFTPSTSEFTELQTNLVEVAQRIYKKEQEIKQVLDL